MLLHSLGYQGLSWEGNPETECEKGEQESEFASPLVHVLSMCMYMYLCTCTSPLVHDGAQRETGQEEDLNGKGIKSRAAQQTQKKKGCFLLIHSSLFLHSGENGE